MSTTLQKCFTFSITVYKLQEAKEKKNLTGTFKVWAHSLTFRLPSCAVYGIFWLPIVAKKRSAQKLNVLPGLRGPQTRAYQDAQGCV